MERRNSAVAPVLALLLGGLVTSAAADIDLSDAITPPLPEVVLSSAGEIEGS